MLNIEMQIVTNAANLANAYKLHNQAVVELMIQKETFDKWYQQALANGKAYGKNDDERKGHARIYIPDICASLHEAELKEKKAHIDLKLAQVEDAKLYRLLQVKDIETRTVLHEGND